MRTTILVTKDTMNKLKERKLAKRESYDEIINRLLEKTKEEE